MRIGRKWLYAAMALTGGFLGGVAAMEFAPGVAIAAHQTRMLRAEQFELVDNSGSKRAVLKVTKRGTADLMMLDGTAAIGLSFAPLKTAGLRWASMTSTGRAACLSARPAKAETE